jgi:hypothetical protein
LVLGVVQRGGVSTVFAGDGRVGPTFDGRGGLKILELTFVPKVVEDFLAMEVKGVEDS